MFYDAVQEMAKMLNNLATFLHEANDFAESNEFDVQNLVNARLAPDMFTLVRQVQTSCDTAKFAAARLTGNDAPSHPDEETTLEELLERIETTIDYLGTVEEADFEDASERPLQLKFLGDEPIAAGKYFIQFAQPNFYFHVTTAYNILRHNGVKLGKRKFIGSIDR